MTPCKFDTYENGKCFHAKQNPYGCKCDPDGCKLKNDNFPPQNKAQDTNPSVGTFTNKWLDFGVDPYEASDEL